jgi:hypothetical protein
MTDFILSSNESSVILNSLNERKTKDLSYSVGESYPILAKQYRELQPNNTSAVISGGEIVFNINKQNLLRDMQIKTTFTTTTTSIGVTTNIGLNMYEWIQLRTNNKVILTMSDAYIWARTQQCGEAKQNAIFRRSLPLAATTELPALSLTAVTYTPVFSSFFENVASSFDLYFYEQLSLACKVNTSTRGGFVGDIATNSVNATLWVWTYRLDAKADAMLKAKNQSISKPLTMLCYNTYTESQVCTSTTQNTMRLNVNYPVFNTYIMIRSGTAALAGIQFKIDSFELSLGGTKLLENVPYLVANWESCSAGASSLQTTSTTATTYDDSKCIAINWGMEPWNRVSNSGAVSFAQINYPTITVNTQNTMTPAASYTIYVVHEYWQVLQLDATNGSVNIAISS